MVRRLKLGSVEQSKVTEKALLKIADDLKSGRTPADRLTISDDLETGLRCLILKSGEATYSVSYHFAGERPYLKIGSARKEDSDYLPLADARTITKTIKALADKGIDVQEGLLPRLRRELLRDGVKWRPK
jgi:hypothetical protein